MLDYPASTLAARLRNIAPIPTFVGKLPLDLGLDGMPGLSL